MNFSAVLSLGVRRESLPVGGIDAVAVTKAGAGTLSQMSWLRPFASL